MWCEAVNSATAIDGVMIPSHGSKCSYEVLHGKTPHCMENLQTCGEIAATKDPANISINLDSHGRDYMFLGYSEDHTQKVYRFLNLNMKKIVYSQDVEWMDVMYGEHTGIKCKSTSTQDYLTDKDESDEKENPVQLKWMKLN